MGWMSNQWLNTGVGLRNRSYCPVGVSVHARIPTSSWSKQNAVVVEFTARRPNCQYQVLDLTVAEIEKAVNIVLTACSADVRRQIAGELLTKLSDVELHEVLAHVLNRRVEDGHLLGGRG